MKDLSDEGIKTYMSLISEPETNKLARKKIKFVLRRMALWEKTLSAFRKGTHFGMILNFAIEREWLDFTVKNLKEWLDFKDKDKDGEPKDYNAIAHSIIQSCERADVTVFSVRNSDDFKAKKTYYFIPSFQNSVKSLFNKLIPLQQWQQEQERKTPESPSEPI